MGISIFAKRAFLNTNPYNEFESKEKSYKGHGHLQRVSSMIRGDQIADFLGAKLNPTEDYENDVCIYVKPHVQRDGDFKFEGKPYLDIVDGWGLLPLLRKHPEVGIIACSQQDFENLSNIFPDRKIVLIPQHHCNFKRIKRDRVGIKAVGVIGTSGAFDFLPKGLKEGLAKRGIEFIEYSKFFSREDIIDFYKKIDIQMVWRPYRMRLSNPLKLVNAASFGIPTVAYDEEVFKELNGCYIGVKTLEDFLEIVDQFRDSLFLYPHYSGNCLEKAEKYHIENVAKLYKQL